MSILIVALLFFILLTLGAGGLVFVVSRKRPAPPEKGMAAPDTGRGPTPVLRRRYALVPFLILIATVACAVYFFRLLPGDVAYRFGEDGSGDGFAGRTALVAAFVAPQLLLSFLAVAIAYVVARIGAKFIHDGVTPLSIVERVITVMSNMVVLPQIVLFFAMLDIFSYNAFEVHLVDPWIVGLVVMLAGGPILAIFFFSAFRRARTREN